MPRRPDADVRRTEGDGPLPSPPATALDELEPLELEQTAVASPTVDPVLAAGAATTAGRRRRGKGLGLGAWLALAWLVLITVLAVLAPVLPLDDPELSDFPSASASPPSADPLLGTDEISRDILSRLIWGARVALVVGICAVLIGMSFGGFFGLLAGYYRGRTEGILMAIADIMLSFPALVFLIAVSVFMGPKLPNITAAIGIIAIPAFARITRAATLSFSQREFVIASRAMGAKNRRIITGEVLPNVILPVTAFALVVVAIAIVAEGGLAFLGLSVPDPKPSWGSMISDGRGALYEGDPHVSLIPATAMFLTVLSFNLLGDRFRAFFDVRESRL